MDADDVLFDCSAGTVDAEQIVIDPHCIFGPLDDTRSDGGEVGDTVVSPKSASISSKMEAPNMASDFPSFDMTTGVPWMTSSMNDPPLLAQSEDQLSQEHWEEWMRWEDPGQQSLSSISADTPSLLQTDAGTTPDIVDSLSPNRSHQSSHSPETRLNSASSYHGNFSFNSHVEGVSNFQYQPSALASPPAMDYLVPDGLSKNNFVWNQPSRMNPAAARNKLSAPASSGASLASPPSEHSPGSAKNEVAESDSGPSPESTGMAPTKRKRKPSSDEDEGPGPDKPVKKTAHNMIEKRYRNNINDKIVALRDSVPSLRVMSRPNGTLEEDDPEDLEGLTPAHKLNKATVLSKATEYIQHLEKRNKRLTDELTDLKTRLETFNKLAMSTPVGMSTTDSKPRFTIEEHYAASSPSAHAQPQMVPQGMIPVPESMAQLHRRHANAPHYAPPSGPYGPYAHASQRQNMAATQQQMVHGRGGSGLMNKVIIGSFAGLMIMEGLAEREEPTEESESKGLFALPLQLVGKWAGLPDAALGATYGPVPTLLLLKLLLLVTACFYLAWPMLTSKSKLKKKSAQVPCVRMGPNISLASPVELRRQAWLTAVQSIWVPQQSFVAEITALGLKVLKLSTRTLIGWQSYAFLTGTTKDQEDGRVKAWSIALDAQLTGGDAEINVRRLILTLMASGTLPETPSRLMLKAVHIRILLWEVANFGYGAWYKFEDASAKLARHYWNRARVEQEALMNRKDITDGEQLPAHLAALLEIDCDDVLVSPLIQRAYNLAWNRPSADQTDIDPSLDSVVEDFAISSPLDAVSAWWSSLILNRGLVSYLDQEDNWKDDLDLALKTSPPNSGAQIRALVAKSILLDDNRDQEVAAAFSAVPSKLSDPQAGSLMNVVGTAPVSADVLKSLTMARCLSLADISKSSRSDAARIRATYPILTNVIGEWSLSLLSFVAAYRVLLSFSADPQLLMESSRGLEGLSNALRQWIGRESGRKIGLSDEARGEIVENCVRLSKLLSGMAEKAESDDGYVSGDETPSKTSPAQACETICM